MLFHHTISPIRSLQPHAPRRSIMITPSTPLCEEMRVIVSAISACVEEESTASEALMIAMRGCCLLFDSIVYCLLSVVGCRLSVIDNWAMNVMSLLNYEGLMTDIPTIYGLHFARDSPPGGFYLCLYLEVLRYLRRYQYVPPHAYVSDFSHFDPMRDKM